MTPQSPLQPKTLPDLFAATDWVLLRTQKAEIVKAIEVPSIDHELLDGMLSFLDAIQDAADLQGYPVFPDETESKAAEAEEKLAEALRLQHAFWDALSELEQVLDIEIDSTSDLAEITVDDLLLQAISELCPSCADKSEPVQQQDQH